ncbi:MAG: hypothetical protein FWG14_10180 [Peptococcaceae bacterium]|nr:hypothetical protein [Peptococcaceae bacterium]
MEKETDEDGVGMKTLIISVVIAVIICVITGGVFRILDIDLGPLEAGIIIIIGLGVFSTCFGISISRKKKK